MGADPERSVVNKWNQSWDVPNLFIVDGSVVATGGVVNPTPTISALALRAATFIRDNFRELSTTTRSMAACTGIMLQPPPAEPGAPVDEVDTPALLIDLDAPSAMVSTSWRRLRARCWRPSFDRTRRTHKSPGHRPPPNGTRRRRPKRTEGGSQRINASFRAARLS